MSNDSSFSFNSGESAMMVGIGHDHNYDIAAINRTIILEDVDLKEVFPNPRGVNSHALLRRDGGSIRLDGGPSDNTVSSKGRAMGGDGGLPPAEILGLQEVQHVGNGGLLEQLDESRIVSNGNTSENSSSP